MPITVQVPDGLFTSDQKDQIFARLTEVTLEVNGASGNPFALRHLIGDILTVPMGRSYAAGKPEPFVNITLRVPVFSLDTNEKQQTFVTAMTDFLQIMAAGKLERDRIYINMIWGDGFWGVGGVAYSNEALLQTAMRSAAANGTSQSPSVIARDAGPSAAAAT